MKEKSRIYFANLDALRFIAASLVVIFHIEHVKKIFGLANYLDMYFFKTIGGIAVTIFFVISGFIITYLLLTEHKKTDKIDIPKFYMRRILRIWPLYYLIVVLGFFILPYIPGMYVPERSLLWTELNWQTFCLFLFFLPNISLVWYGHFPYMDQSWSIAVEEQFYIIWPLLLKKFSYSIKMIMAFVILTIIFTNSYILTAISGLIGIHISKKVMTFLYLERFSCMGIGGLGAYILYNRKTVFSFIYIKQYQLIIYLTTVIFLVLGINKYLFLALIIATVLIKLLESYKRYLNAVTIGYSIFFIYLFLTNTITHTISLETFTHEIIATLFCVIILNMANPDSSILNTNNRGFLYLGKVSYGIYMYHNIFIVISIKLIKYVFNTSNYQIPIYLLTFFLTITASIISYEYYEKFFMRIKSKKYTIVKSGAAT